MLSFRARRAALNKSIPVRILLTVLFEVGLLAQGHRSGSWRVDETYVRVGGRWRYLFRAVDKHGQLIAFMLSDCRNTKAAYRFLHKATKAMSHYPPSTITTDKLASYPNAILRLQNEGLLPKDVVHRTSKYLNNILEADHGALKRVIRRGHCIQRRATGEICLVDQLFGLAAWATRSTGFVILFPIYCNSAPQIIPLLRRRLRKAPALATPPAELPAGDVYPQLTFRWPAPLRLVKITVQAVP